MLCNNTAQTFANKMNQSIGYTSYPKHQQGKTQKYVLRKIAEAL